LALVIIVQNCAPSGGRNCVLHKINFPATCRPYFEWIATLQRRLLTALCQDSIENPHTVDEAWLISALGDFTVDQDWFGRFCNWKHEGQTLLERARSIAGFSTEIKTRLLADFENDHIFESLFDPQTQDAHDLVGLAPLKVLNPQAAEVVHRFFESFYTPAFYKGYKILIEDELTGFDRKKFVQRFVDANPNVCVCPMCDGYLGNAQVDHFFPKAAYPYLSCHPLNLVPICGDCNGSGGKGGTPPLSLDSSSHQTDDWFHPYLRSAHGTYTVGFERQREGTTPVLTSEDKQAQARLDNMSALLKLGERWRRTLSLKTRIAQRRIWRVRRTLGRSLTEAELCDRLAEWAKSAEDEIGLESFAIIKIAYFQSASQKKPNLFNELWIYNVSNTDVVTASGR